MLTTLIPAVARSASRRQSRSAFTLVELLVTIAILGTLIGVSVPTLSLARNRMRKTHCQANMREIGMLFQMHLDMPRNYQTLPKACRNPDFNSANLPPISIVLDNTAKVLKQTTKNAKGEDEEKKINYSTIQSLFHCPSDDDFYARIGLSYEYRDSLGGKKLPEILRTSSGRRRDPHYEYVLSEFEPFHGMDDESPYAQNRHYLYLDWHVDDGVPESVVERETNSLDGGATLTDPSATPADPSPSPTPSPPRSSP